MKNVENNLFKVMLVGVLSIGALTVISAKTYENTNNKPTVVITKNEQQIPQVIIVGKRIPKEHALLANR